MFIDRLNEALKRNNISGNALCKKLDMPNANYTNWKKQIPKGETLKLIANELHVSVDWLLERENAMEPSETELIDNYRASDADGKITIISVAELEARRSRKEQAQKDEELKPFA
ncbi:MAG: helix-turn-helix transcriptional regulator [Lachnospiraceae bacterium]|nr:helix-turn-helix transcriptional regulator [Lachnospiraceae bacterium]